MPAIRLASHYLRRKPFPLSFFFFWMRGCEPLDSHSACMGRKITIRFSNTKTCSLDRFRLRWPSHSAFNTKHSVKRAVLFSQAQSFVPDSHLEGLWKDSGLFTQRLDSLLLDGSIRTVLLLTDRQTLIEVAPFKTRKSDPKWCELSPSECRAVQKAAN